MGWKARSIFTSTFLSLLANPISNDTYVVSIAIWAPDISHCRPSSLCSRNHNWLEFINQRVKFGNTNVPSHSEPLPATHCSHGTVSRSNWAWWYIAQWRPKRRSGNGGGKELRALWPWKGRSCPLSWKKEGSVKIKFKIEVCFFEREHFYNHDMILIVTLCLIWGLHWK